MTNHRAHAALCALSALCLSTCHRTAQEPLRSARTPPATVASERLPQTEPPHAATTWTPPDHTLGYDALRQTLPSGARLTTEALRARHPTRFAPAAAIDLSNVEYHERVEQGAFALSAGARQQLRTSGMVLAREHDYPNFMAGYFRLYVADQPVYISADAVLNALHLSFDELVANIEEDALAPTLHDALGALRTKLASQSATLDAQTRADLDLFLAVPFAELEGRPAGPVAGADDAVLTAVHSGIAHPAGMATVRLYGADRLVDFSQFTPRGHYAGIPARERFFRAVMWLGREGLRLVDVDGGHRVLMRRQVALALALRALSGPNERAAFASLDRAVSAFAGEPESLTFADLDNLAAEIDRGGGLATLSDTALLGAIDRVRGERPRVATTLLVHPNWLSGPAPQPVQFSLVPQRYTPDSRVLSAVSFDRVDRRMMPEALDAAYGALGNDQALGLLAPSLDRFGYATELETVHGLIDAHEASYWSGSMYASWLAALRTLSPRETLAEGGPMPATMATEAWGLRLLNTQMAAWSEVRHDMVLYAAQSYSAMPGCSYPAAYVDPYPAFWDALGQWVARGRTLIADTPWRTPARRTTWTTWAQHAETVARHLGEIARTERSGEDLSREQLAWVNQALVVHEENVVCTTITTVTGGWYYSLFEPRLELGDHRAMVADVHTQPADENGNPVGRVLHIGTGDPTLMAVVAGVADHPRVYLGLASNYLERTTSNFERLTDQRWREQLAQANAPAWLQPIAPGR